ncbi:hypothetical protein OG906_43175 (plasmid) [Streptomyces sp. NBC_01426]|uniref:hypothetical protein n=1 Tax=Streptomyces sp. NBC_01426 TaxID=2975866 RepID=UPI002E2EAC16|nr:hypothetical protein [Streptomyces sp. NBC_01426]
MDWKQLRKDLADAVELRNRRVASLRTAGSTVAELAAQALAAGAPDAPLRRILAAMEPVIEHERRPQQSTTAPEPPPGSPQVLADGSVREEDPALDSSHGSQVHARALAKAWHPRADRKPGGEGDPLYRG